MCAMVSARILALARNCGKQAPAAGTSTRVVPADMVAADYVRSMGSLVQIVSANTA